MYSYCPNEVCVCVIGIQGLYILKYKYIIIFILSYSHLNKECSEFARVEVKGELLLSILKACQRPVHKMAHYIAVLSIALYYIYSNTALPRCALIRIDVRYLKAKY